MADEMQPRDHSEPDSSQQPEIIFSLTLARPALDYILERNGMVPTEDIRLTVVTELNNNAPHWVDSVVEKISMRLTSLN